MQSPSFTVGPTCAIVNAGFLFTGSDVTATHYGRTYVGEVGKFDEVYPGRNTLVAIVYDQVLPTDVNTFDPDDTCIRTMGNVRQGDLNYVGIRFDWTSGCGVTHTGVHYTMTCA